MTVTKANRNFGFDNVKCILMFLVVFGHLLEFCNVYGGACIYRLIYFFHMPVFIFISGYFAKENPTFSGIFRQTVIYVVFQTVYIAVTQNTLNYTTPYWILWYCLVLIFYNILTPFYNAGTTKKRAAAIIVTFALAILAGFDDSVGYYMSLSRFFVFQPFFLLGFYYRKEETRVQSILSPKTKAAVIFAAALTVPYALFSKFPPKFLYGSFSYSALDCSAAVRACILITAVIWSGLFILVLVPALNRKLPVISAAGANTLPVYLFHGFIILLLKHFHRGFMDNWLFVLAVAAACLLLLGSRFMSSLFNFRFRRR